MTLVFGEQKKFLEALFFRMSTKLEAKESERETKRVKQKEKGLLNERFRSKRKQQ